MYGLSKRSKTTKTFSFLINLIKHLHTWHMFVFQLIAAYSAPSAPPEAAEFTYESASTRFDFKDSDMKRLSVEIERER